ncbi:GAF domain-containing protein [Hymenobacter cellulosilyticus]|uniref:GAF domain-containing protein n=1 Tax=Hymenobacter cellulosilyticus TaxID=2932248 RepID=A0A8T9QEQ3_9BACT|nr:GAF domain-containing protein [Hymenobacter cellulosilyticus]UOQ74901.1 GAF domain-containing protein [Hymenobacter cellulosilyticus]
MPTPTSLIPANDPQRLQALLPYLSLGTEPDAVFDEIVRLTAKLFQVPIALVSLVEEGSVWFKANFGLPGAVRVNREQSICSVAVLHEDTTVYEDLQREPCHLTDPKVAEALELRFYAGHPLRTEEGHQIGALCVIDRQPRTLSAVEQRRLQALAGLVMKILDLRQLLQQRPEQAQAIWTLLYGELDDLLTRIGTLTKLARGEAGANSPAGPASQHSIDEEAEVVIWLLEQHTADALAALRPPAEPEVTH